ncbi:solute carrier family 22 member 13 isoform X2 [Esox lucius]|uniref:solute carrier family 22 member 13 isoform X2 n=1 Tax=Esox lucius TaxID=8010 RepID=UPI001476ED67|nr:solute carrier family 22 member 13 isoform X2 [Esox lucius]
MAPLQLAVYWRLALIFIFTAFIFLVDVFTVSRTSYLCTNFSRELGAEKRSRGEVPSDASTQNHSTSEEHEGNGSLQLVSIHTQDEITWWNDTKRENGTECLDPEVLSYGQTLFMTGLLVGSLFGGAVSDRYGKRVLLLVCVCVNPVTSALPAVLHHAVFFLALRCLAGVSCCCINICSFSLGVEWSLPKHRMWPPALLSFSFSLGMIVMAPLVYLTHTWVQLHLALAIPQIVCLPAFFYIPESPSWLLVKRRTDTLEKYSRHSPEDKRFLDLLLDTRTEQDVPLDTLTPDSDTHTTDSNTHIPEKYTHTPDKETHTPKTATPSQEEHTLSDLGHMRSPTILLRLAIMGYIGLASALTYYGICMNVGRFGVDVFLAQFFSGLSETPCLLVPFLLARCGRRPTSMLSLLLSGSFCLLSLLVSRFCDIPVLVMALALVGKLCMQTTVFVSLLYGIELFPTVIRLGCILNAVISPSGETIPVASMIIFGSGPIIGAGLCLLLPETSGVPLPDSLADCDRQPRLSLSTLPHVWSSCLRRRSANAQAAKACPFLTDPEASHNPQELNSADASHTHIH